MKAPLASLPVSIFAFLLCASPAAATSSAPDGETQVQALDADSGALRTLDAPIQDESVARALALRAEMATAIQTAREAEEAAVAALVTRLDGASAQQQAAIQEEIVAAKRNGWIGILSIRADFARRAGFEEAAAKMEQEIEQLRAPKIETTPRTATDRRRDESAVEDGRNR